MKHKRIIIPVAIVVLAVAAVTAISITHGSSANAQPIPDGVYFKQVKELSQGAKPQCLSDNKTASKQVESMPQPKDFGDSFGLALGTRILDMPAGEFDDTVHAFDGKQATGTITFSDKNQKAFAGDLDTFNYVAKVDAAHKWKLTTMIACVK